MTDTIPTYTARTLLTASINHVRHTLAALDHVTLRPHRVAGTTLTEASLMDDVMARADLIVPRDPCAVDDPAPVLRLIKSLGNVVNSGHSIAREVTYCAHDTRGMQQIDQCWAASRPVQDLTRQAWDAACTTAREPRRVEPRKAETVPFLEQASDARDQRYPRTSNRSHGEPCPRCAVGRQGVGARPRCSVGPTSSTDRQKIVAALVPESRE